MKTTKLFLSIALVALTAISFGMNKETENIVFENELVVENWMTRPFETITMENELTMEDWMTSSFGLGTELEALILESWMTTPFETTDDNCSGVLLAATCI
jgi:hypothetical protein